METVIQRLERNMHVLQGHWRLSKCHPTWQQLVRVAHSLHLVGDEPKLEGTVLCSCYLSWKAASLDRGHRCLQCDWTGEAVVDLHEHQVGVPHGSVKTFQSVDPSSWTFSVELWRVICRPPKRGARSRRNVCVHFRNTERHLYLCQRKCLSKPKADIGCSRTL